MEREEILELLRTRLGIEIVMDTDYECGRSYVTCRASLLLDGEEIARDYDSVSVDND